MRSKKVTKKRKLTAARVTASGQDIPTLGSESKARLRTVAAVEGDSGLLSIEEPRLGNSTHRKERGPTRKWKIWADNTSNSKEEAIEHFPDLVEWSPGPWTADEVYQVWSALFRLGEGTDARMAYLVALIEDNAFPWMEGDELVRFLADLHSASIKCSDESDLPEFNATKARAALRMICKALIGPGGRTKKRKPAFPSEAARVEAEKETKALFVLTADRESAVRRRKGEEVTLLDVLHERLRTGNHPFWSDRTTSRSFLQVLAAMSEDPTVPPRFGLTLVGGKWHPQRTKTYRCSDHVMALNLDREFRIFVRKHKTKWEIHRALGLKKRRNRGS